MEELRDKLLDWAKQFETPDFIDDPIFFPHFGYSINNK